MDHNSLTNLRKMTANNPKVDLVSLNSYTKFGQNLSICSQDIEQKQAFGVKSWAITPNNQNLDLFNMNACIKFDDILSICYQDTEQKQNFGVNEGP